MPMLDVIIHNVNRVINTDDLRTIEQSMDLLKVSRMTIYRWIEEHRLSPIVIADKTFIHLEEIERINKERGNGNN